MVSFKTGLIDLDQAQAWNTLIAACGTWEVYHTAEYHLIAEEHGEGRAILYYFEWQGRHAALPMLVRPLSQLEGFEGCLYWDATSVYGYAGCVTDANPDWPLAEEFRRHFQNGLLSALRDLRVITLFSRLNPLLPSTWMLDGLAEIRAVGTTVAIAVCDPESEQLKGLRRGHRYDLKKAEKMGITVLEDQTCDNINMFIDMYYDTMTRVGAPPRYFLPVSYFERLRDLLPQATRLFFAFFEGAVIAGSICLASPTIMQYHLAAARNRVHRVGGNKVIINAVRRSITGTHFRWFHLGGGFGSQRDQLFQFKAGFSTTRLTFQVARLVVDSSAYMEAAAVEERRLQASGKMHGAYGDFFPSYRQPR